MEPRDYDRIEINKYDKQKFYGYDDEDGTTTWYTEDNILDCITPTPCDDEYDGDYDVYDDEYDW